VFLTEPPDLLSDVEYDRSVDSQLEAVNWQIILNYGLLFIDLDLHL
jgi:hypothetical protein